MQIGHVWHIARLRSEFYGVLFFTHKNYHLKLYIKLGAKGHLKHFLGVCEDVCV